jgi:hypothetical protein
LKPIQDNEIDFFELCNTLWGSKWIITAFTLIAILIGSGFIFSKQPAYESKLTYFINNAPPYYKDDEILKDFHEKFFSKNIFEDWKKDFGKSVLKFEDFNTTELYNGVIIAKSEYNQLARMISTKKGNKYILVKTNNVSMLSDFFEYSQYIIQLLDKVYLYRAKDQINLVESRFKKFSKTNALSSSIDETVLLINKFIVRVENNEPIIIMKHPTFPKKLSTNSTLILVLSIVLGGITGTMYVLILNTIHQRRKIA